MRFEIPFNENLSRKQSEKYFNHVWRDFNQKNRRKLYFGIPFIILGVATIYGKDNVGYVVGVIGFYYLLNFLEHHRIYKINKTKYFKSVEKHILEYSSTNKPCIWELNDMAFYYIDFKYDLKINWNSFSKFTIIENDLILELRDNIIADFFLNKEEVGDVNFDKIILFLKEKIKNS